MAPRERSIFFRQILDTPPHGCAFGLWGAVYMQADREADKESGRRAGRHIPPHALARCGAAGHQDELRHTVPNVGCGGDVGARCCHCVLFSFGAHAAGKAVRSHKSASFIWIFSLPFDPCTTACSGPANVRRTRVCGYRILSHVQFIYNSIHQRGC